MKFVSRRPARREAEANAYRCVIKYAWRPINCDDGHTYDLVLVRRPPQKTHRVRARSVWVCPSGQNCVCVNGVRDAKKRHRNYYGRVQRDSQVERVAASRSAASQRRQQVIRPLKTTKVIDNVNVMLRLLTQSKTSMGYGTIPGVTDERHYILGICDWCAHREIIDDPEPKLGPAPYEVNKGHEARAQAFVDGLNWIIGSTWMRVHGKHGRQFCSRRCRDTHDEAVRKGSCET